MQKVDTKTLKPGDSIFLCHNGSWSNSYVKGTVVKVTPSGMVDVKGNGESVTRYNSAGNAIGSKYVYHDSIDLYMAFEERQAHLQQIERKKAAAEAINQIKLERQARYEWDKTCMLRELDELQAKLEKARELVNAV